MCPVFIFAPHLLQNVVQDGSAEPLAAEAAALAAAAALKHGLSGGFSKMIAAYFQTHKLRRVVVHVRAYMMLGGCAQWGTIFQPPNPHMPTQGL